MTDHESAELAGSGENGTTTPITDSITSGATKSAEGFNALIRHANWCGIDGAVCSDTAGIFDLAQYNICGLYPLAEAPVYPVYRWISNPEKPPNAMHKFHFGIICFLLAVNCGAAAESSFRCILYILPNKGPDRWVCWLKWLKSKYPVVPRHTPVLISSMNFRASIFCLVNFFWYYNYSSMYVTDSKGALIATLVPLCIHFILLAFWCVANRWGTDQELEELLADKSIPLPTSRKALSPHIEI